MGTNQTLHCRSALFIHSHSSIYDLLLILKCFSQLPSHIGRGWLLLEKAVQGNPLRDEPLYNELEIVKKGALLGMHGEVVKLSCYVGVQQIPHIVQPW